MTTTYSSTAPNIVTVRSGDIEVIARRDEVGAIRFDQAWNNLTNEYVLVHAFWADAVREGVAAMFEKMDLA